MKRSDTTEQQLTGVGGPARALAPAVVMMADRMNNMRKEMIKLNESFCSIYAEFTSVNNRLQLWQDAWERRTDPVYGYTPGLTGFTTSTVVTATLDDSLENCPACNAQLQGGQIREEQQHLYGATHWSRKIGISSRELDRVVEWKCPDCGHNWDRE
jgi:hypothetical protein